VKFRHDWVLVHTLFFSIFISLVLMFYIAGDLVVAAPVFLAVGSGPLFSFKATTFEAKLIGFQILADVNFGLELIIGYVVSAALDSSYRAPMADHLVVCLKIYIPRSTELLSRTSQLII
jgi:hypothetical protein